MWKPTAKKKGCVVASGEEEDAPCVPMPRAEKLASCAIAWSAICAPGSGVCCSASGVTAIHELPHPAHPGRLVFPLHYCKFGA